MSKKNNKIGVPLNNAEKMLSLLPKRCNCNTCEETKSFARAELGERRYISFCKETGLQ